MSGLGVYSRRSYSRNQEVFFVSYRAYHLILLVLIGVISNLYACFAVYMLYKVFYHYDNHVNNNSLIYDANFFLYKTIFPRVMLKKILVSFIKNPYKYVHNFAFKSSKKNPSVKRTK